jgi:hypothetical protein
LNRVAGSELFGLFDEFDRVAEIFPCGVGGERFPDVIGFVTNDRKHTAGLNLGHAIENALNQRLRAEGMQDFGERRFHASPATRRKDCDRYHDCY